MRDLMSPRAYSGVEWIGVEWSGVGGLSGVVGSIACPRCDYGFRDFQGVKRGA